MTTELSRQTTPAAPERSIAPATTRDVLHRAADLIEEFGHATGVRGMPHKRWSTVHPLCLEGAVCQAAIDYGLAEITNTFWGVYRLHGQAMSGYDVAESFLPEPDGSWNTTMGKGPFWWAWNDRPGTTQADVVAKLRQVAEAS